MTRQGSALLAGIACAAAFACARALPPPGGPDDNDPPRIIATTPEPLGTMVDTTAAVEFQFDERISERGFTASMVLVSPATGEVEVDRSGSRIRVRLKDGWRRNEVYRVVVEPGYADLFGNSVVEPAELVFSTGAPILPTAIAGLVTDRLTGLAAEDAIVEARRMADNAIFSTVPDTGAFFALRFLPLGGYDVRSFVDRNANRKLDPTEPVSASQTVAVVQTSDTVPLTLRIVPQDTTPARLTRASATDSLEVRLTFDDYLEPEASLDSVSAQLFRMPDSTAVAQAPSLAWPVAFERDKIARADSLAAEAAAAADTAGAVADTTGAAADTTGAAADTTAAAPPGRAGRAGAAGAARAGGRGGGLSLGAAGGRGRGGVGPSGEQLPTRDLVLVPGEPLEPGATYAVVIANATNVTGIAGGGGFARFEVPARPDTAQVPLRFR